MEASCKPQRPRLAQQAPADSAWVLFKTRNHDPSIIAWALVSALYDPSDDVLARALEAVGRDRLDSQPDAGNAALTGVIAAFRVGRRRVRVVSVWAARAFESQSGAHALLEAAEADASWEVRYAVQVSGRSDSCPDVR
jgi:hypothetical protein